MSKEISTRPTDQVSHVVSEQRYPAPQSYSFDQLVRMATSFAKSGLFGVKDADSALALLLVAQAEGRSPALVMRDYDVIQGRLAKKADAMLRDYQSSGGKVEWIELSDTRAAANFSHPLSPKPLPIDWDVARAEKAGLTKKEGGMYTKYTRAMLRSRCISEGVRSTAPGATSQSYTPEEIREIEQEASAPIKMKEAITQATEQVKNAIPKEEVDVMIMSMDVKTMPELIKAFGTAYAAAKHAGDDIAKKRLQSTYEDMKSAIEGGEIV